MRILFICRKNIAHTIAKKLSVVYKYLKPPCISMSEVYEKDFLGCTMILAELSSPILVDGKQEAVPSTEPQSRGEALSGKKVIVADANSTHHLNLYAAYEKGLFAKRALDVEIRQTASWGTAVVGEEADIVFNCQTGVITPIAKGQAIAIISHVKIPCTSVLVVPINSPYRTPADLKCQQIAWLSNTCCAVIVIRESLKSRYNTEFELAMLAPGADLASLEAGQVKGAILEEPFASLELLKTDASGKPLFKRIFDGSSDDEIIVFCRVMGLYGKEYRLICRGRDTEVLAGYWTCKSAYSLCSSLI
jgi:NitT/TauT family transport system substrate-binding protein